jgi:serine/threonine protein kinase
MLDYKNKYLKYKQKYFNLKKMIGGGTDATYEIIETLKYKNSDGLDNTKKYTIILKYKNSDGLDNTKKYTLIEKLGEGTTGIVYKIKENDTENFYIFKMGKHDNIFVSNDEGIKSEMLKGYVDDDMLVSFQGKIPNDFLISKYNGKDLYQEFSSNNKTKKEYADVTIQLLELLHKINSNVIFHNDIKLGNITIRDDKVYLIDFGLLTKGISHMGSLISMSFNGLIGLLIEYKYNEYNETFHELQKVITDTDMVGFFYCCIDLLFLLDNKHKYIYQSIDILYELGITELKIPDLYRLFNLFYFILPTSKRNIMTLNVNVTLSYFNFLLPNYNLLPTEYDTKIIFGEFPNENTNLFRFMAYIYKKIELYLIKNQSQQKWYKDFLKIMSACFLPEFNYDEFKKNFEDIVSKFSENPHAPAPVPSSGSALLLI